MNTNDLELLDYDKELKKKDKNAIKQAIRDNLDIVYDVCDFNTFPTDELNFETGPKQEEVADKRRNFNVAKNLFDADLHSESMNINEELMEAKVEIGNLDRETKLDKEALHSFKSSLFSKLGLKQDASFTPKGL